VLRVDRGCVLGMKEYVMEQVKSASCFNSLAEKILLRGLTAEELPKLAVLKPGKTFGDFKKAWETPAPNETGQFTHEAVVARQARRLFLADVFERSLVPDDGF